MTEFHSFVRNTRGSTVTMFALSLPVMFGAVGAGTMYSFSLMTKTELQAAVDAGALAGTALGAPASKNDRIKAAARAYAGNFHGSGAMIEEDSSFWVKSDTPPKFAVSNIEVSGEAEAKVRNIFSFAVGDEWLPIKVHATAAKQLSDPICILGLNPEHKETIDMTGQPVITARGCAAQANSKDGAGINQKGKPTFKAKMIGTTGGYTGTAYEPTPMKGTIPVEDPYKDLPFPDSSHCDYHDTIYSGSGTVVTLDPGIYCGGLRIKAGAQVTLRPGIYIMKDDALWLNGDSRLSGEEVMIGFTGEAATLYMEGRSEVHVTSPVSGTYMNMQFMQQPHSGGDDLYFSIIGNSKLSFEGVLYAPTFDVWFAGGSTTTVSSPSYALVADKIWIQDQSALDVTYENKRHLPIELVGRFKYGARLTQ